MSLQGSTTTCWPLIPPRLFTSSAKIWAWIGASPRSAIGLFHGASTMILIGGLPDPPAPVEVPDPAVPVDVPDDPPDDFDELHADSATTKTNGSAHNPRYLIATPAIRERRHFRSPADVVRVT